MKYLGTAFDQIPPNVRSATVVSVPTDLASSSEALDQWYNQLYTRRFMKSLKHKFIYKSQQFPGKIEMSQFDRIKTWREFDNTFTVQVTGFASADEYYQQGSAKYFIDGIRINTLIINAINDPFLQQASYPVINCEKHHYVYLEMPRYGGHVGFWFPSYQESYAESRVMQFIKQFD
ncbi:MAG: hypothetical protein IPL46_25855 [Saprospiraceae bacterium]|nr:hypothetical protein [Saprospiraceae bacterium]